MPPTLEHNDRAPTEEFILFSLDHRSDHEVEPIPRVLPIAPSTIYDYRSKQVNLDLLSDRANRDEALRPEIKRGRDQIHAFYGARKMWHQVRRETFGIAGCTVARLMKDLELEGVIRGKKPKTTITDKSQPCPLDKVHSYFKTPAPNVL